MTAEVDNGVAHLRLVIEATREQNAQRVVNRLLKIVPAEPVGLDPYFKGGYEARLTIRVPPTAWPEQVYFVIGLAQDFGYGWEIAGHVSDDLSLHGAKFKIPGLVSATLTLTQIRQGSAASEAIA